MRDVKSQNQIAFSSEHPQGENQLPLSPSYVLCVQDRHPSGEGLTAVLGQGPFSLLDRGQSTADRKGGGMGCLVGKIMDN